MVKKDEEPTAPKAPENSRRRGDWPVRVYRLGEEPGDDLSATTTPEERIAMVWQLTLDAWAMAGRELPPRIPHSEWPIFIKRLGEPDSAAVRLTPAPRPDDDTEDRQRDDP